MSILFVKKCGLIAVLLGLQSCQLIDVVIAQSDQQLRFETKNEVKYAAEILPDEVIQQIKDENFEPNSNWIGDPRRFKVRKIQQLGQSKPLYYINPSIECPERGCDMFYHTPMCGGTGGCTYLGYIEENGKYRKVFDKLFWLQGSDSPQVSLQISSEGVPACFELPGYDWDSREKGLPSLSEGEIFMSRYCYNGTEYTLNQIRVVPTEQGLK